CCVLAGGDVADASATWSGGAEVVLLEEAAQPEKLAVGGGELFLEFADCGAPGVSFLAEPGGEDVHDVVVVCGLGRSFRGWAPALLGAEFLDPLAQVVVAVEEVEADPGGARD